MRIVLEIERGEGRGQEKLGSDFVNEAMRGLKRVIFYTGERGSYSGAVYEFVSVRLVATEKNPDTWLTLCKKAAKALTPNQYQRWQFMVGTSGTDAERLARGHRALEQVRPSAVGGGIKFNVIACPAMPKGVVRMCTCGTVKSGSSTSGHWCPVHGQKF